MTCIVDSYYLLYRNNNVNLVRYLVSLVNPNNDGWNSAHIA